ncbi:MAG: sulfurtransferase [Gemmatimonadetes bacterium]|nr:sulfurtransferase [Gemmatimonadota bacterium]MCA9764150.1 sulfurtransferase [Gemmatimonadota bacterium]MCB9505909.1 sulfurtransferase [Gemmatimonadales bacterium]
MTAQSSAPPLVSAHQLAAALGAADLTIVDASWYLASAGRDADAEYRIAHVPGAVRMGLELISDPNSDLPHMLPSADRFAVACETLGIGPHHRVVIYDGSGTNLSAARAWWTFRVFGHRNVSVLDGGFRAWAGATRPVQMGLQRRSRTGYPLPAVDRALVVGREEVEAVSAGTLDAQLVDCRSAERFSGKVDEPRPGLRRGHIPGSRNIPFEMFTNRGTGRMHAVPVLRELLHEQGLDPARRIIATCGSGVSACVLALAVEVIRSEDPGAVGPPVAIYDGSWAEYGRIG